MHYPDACDWHGCEAVQFNPDKLSGRATVGATRMDADGVLSNFDDGLSEKEIAESFQVDLDAVRNIIAFAQSKRMKAIA